MPNASTLEAMSPGLLKVVERAKREPKDDSTHWRISLMASPQASLSPATFRCGRLGVDGVPKEQYGQDLEQPFRSCTRG